MVIRWAQSFLNCTCTHGAVQAIEIKLCHSPCWYIMTHPCWGRGFSFPRVLQHQGHINEQSHLITSLPQDRWLGWGVGRQMFIVSPQQDVVGPKPSCSPSKQLGDTGEEGAPAQTLAVPWDSWAQANPGAQEVPTRV